MRPTHRDVTPAEILSVAKKLIDECPNFIMAGVTAEMIVCAVEDDGLNADGFTLAQFIDNNYVSAAMTSTIAEELESIRESLNDIYISKVKEWVKDNSIRPIYKVGDSVQFKWMHGYQGGIIYGIKEDTAQYLIDIGKACKPSVGFEDVISNMILKDGLCPIVWQDCLNALLPKDKIFYKGDWFTIEKIDARQINLENGGALVVGVSEIEGIQKSPCRTLGE